MSCRCIWFRSTFSIGKAAGMTRLRSYSLTLNVRSCLRERCRTNSKPIRICSKGSTCRALWLGCVTLSLPCCIRSGWGHVSKRRFRDFAPGNLASSVPDEVRLLLAQAGILTPADHSECRFAEWSEIARVRAQAFRERNSAPLSNLIHPFNLAALRRYYRYAVRRGAIRLGDEQSARRYVAHNECVARYFHHQIANAVSAIVGEPVKPSYVYLASYLSGAELKKHTDRQQCEFSVTLCLDFSPEPERATSWPLRLDTPEGTVTVYQALGDGLVYRGTKVPHYRDALGKGYTSTSIFFHYVPLDFSGSLD